MDHRLADSDEPKCTVYHGDLVPPDPAYPGHWRDAGELWANGQGDEAALLIVDRSMLERRDRLRQLPRGVVLVAADAASHEALGRRAPISIAGLDDRTARNRVIYAACRLACERKAVAVLRQRLARRRLETRELNRIGMALMLEPDREELLRQIVRQGKRLTQSDSGALLLMETDEHDVQRLRPVLWEFDFLPELRMPPTTYPIDETSVPGYAAYTGETIVVDDVYNLPADSPFQHDKTLDEAYGYYTKSGLIVPMVDHRGRAVGVLALGNRKSDPDARITKESADRYVLSYTDREVELARSLASQAAVSIEIHQLYGHIEDMLESFIKSGVTAIDQRDPATAGHSLRVARIATALASAVDRADGGKYRDVHFSRAQMRELRYAALVHDVGKVAVREDVLMKSKKLPPVLWERVDARFDLIHRTIQLEYCKRRANLRRSAADRDAEAHLDAELAGQLKQLERIRRIVAVANEPGANAEHSTALKELDDIASRTFQRVDGGAAPYLTDEELHFLRIRSGTLDDDERSEVESHVDEGRMFLADIPLTDDLKNLVTYACDHHEKLDGSGYPKGLKGDEIPLQARLITLADMFDALTEGDRPYKPAMPVDEALGLLRSEARAGRLDSDLLEIMIQSRAFA